jgi:hypothetical protein
MQSQPRAVFEGVQAVVLKEGSKLFPQTLGEKLLLLLSLAKEGKAEEED